MNAGYSIVVAAHSHLGFEGLASLINQSSKYRVCGYEEQRAGLVDALLHHEADLLLMCYRFATDSVGDIIAEVKQKLPEVSIVIVSAQPRSFDAVTSLYNAGANAFLCSTTANQQALFNALDQVVDGHNYYTNSYKDRLIETTVVAKPNTANTDKPKQSDHTPQLGQREIQVLGLIAKGYSAKEVARLLDISKNTVEVHRRNIMIKLNLRKSTELTRYAIENKLVDLSG